jgi:hypothetical protein
MPRISAKKLAVAQDGKAIALICSSIKVRVPDSFHGYEASYGKVRIPETKHTPKAQRTT